MNKDDKNKAEMMKTVIMLQEMVEDGFITPQDAIVKSMQEGMKLAECTFMEKIYTCPITYKEGA